MQLNLFYFRYEMAWFPNKTSTWCSFFSYEDLKTFEYLEDLKYYYKDGYAYNITAEMTQPLFNDLIQRLSDLKDGLDGNSTILNFAHLETVLPFLTSLGLYKDDRDLLASDWPSKGHLWKTSSIGSFASNVAIVALECKTTEIQKSNKMTDSLEEFNLNESSEERDVKNTKVYKKKMKKKESKLSSEEEDASKSEEDFSSEEEDILDVQEQRFFTEDESSETTEKLFDEEQETVQSTILKLALYHQERLVKSPWCNDFVCDLDHFLQQFRELAFSDLTRVCEVTM